MATGGAALLGDSDGLGWSVEMKDSHGCNQDSSLELTSGLPTPHQVISCLLPPLEVGARTKVVGLEMLGLLSLLPSFLAGEGVQREEDISHGSLEGTQSGVMGVQRP